MTPMMRTQIKVVAVLGLALLSAGCKEGAGLFSGLFGGSGSSGGSSFSGSSSDGGGDVILSTGSGRAFDVSPATVHNPEPGSLALFGGGLAGLAAWRRKRKAKRIS